MKFKRFLALALSLLMVFGGAASIFAADDDATTEAEEVTAANPYQAAIDALKVLGIFKGDDNGDSADKAVNRWQMALFVSRALTGEVDDAYWGKTAYDYSKFTDITDTASLYLGAIGFANQKGIILGYDDPKTGKSIFNPDGGITYQDALTMATRTLGFTGLAYPWGVIEKAIDLELTKGLVDVGYQDELTRGEVAQIVYNMLIAKVVGADGEYWTLKDKAFGIQEAVVVIVAGDQVRYTLDNEVTKRDNYVSFQILGEDGKVTEPVYSISAKAFGIDTDEDNDAYVGYSYSVATSNDFASFVSCEMNETVTYWNLGKTTKGTEFTATKFNEGKANEYTKLVVVNPDDAKDTTDNYSIVEKYTTLRTIQGAKTGVELIPGDSELLVYDPSVKSTIVTKEGSGYYTDAAGNILEAKADQWDAASGRYVTRLTIKYYYNKFTDSYYEKVTNTSYLVGDSYVDGYYVPVSAETVAKLKVGYETDSKWSFGQITGLGSISSTYAYSSLTLIDDYRAYEGYDRAIYKAYGLGKVVTSEKDGDGNLRTKIKTPTGIVADVTTVLDRKTSATALSEAPPTFVDAVTGKTLDTPKDGAWILYYYNGMTNTVEVLETLTVEKGVLTGWNIAGKTVTVGNEKYPANYDTLLNNGIVYTGRTIGDTKYTDDSIKVKNNQELYKLYTRSVNYIVIDGDVVWIEANAVDTAGVVVLHSFLGITSDGMLEYYAYTTKNPGSLQKIKVNAINNWYYGYYTNTTNSITSAYLNILNNTTVKGQIYKIDAIDDAGVYYLSDPESSVRNLNFDTYYRAVFTNGSFKQNGMTGDAITSISIATDTYYVFVSPTADATTGARSIITAKGNPGTIPLDLSGTYYWASSKMIVAILDATSWEKVASAFDTTTSIKYYYAPNSTNYPVASTGTDATGSAVITYAKLINIATGQYEDVITTNLKVTKGGTYKAEDGVIVARLSGVALNTVWTQVTSAYTSALLNNSGYVYGGTVTVTNFTPNEKLDTRFENLRAKLITAIGDQTSTSKMAVSSPNAYTILKNNKDVTLRAADIDSSYEIVISDDSNGNENVIPTKQVAWTYKIAYFYNTTSGKVAAYIIDKYETPAVVPSTIVDIKYYIGESLNGAYPAKIIANATSITVTYQGSAAFAPSGVSLNGSSFKLEKYELINGIWAWRSVVMPLVYNNSIVTSSNNGQTAIITFNNGTSAATLDSGTYRVSAFEIYTKDTNSVSYGHIMADGEYVEFVVE